MSTNIYHRIILDAVMFIAVVNGWWFVAVPLGLVGVWVFPYYIEFIIAGIAYDALFGMMPATGVWGYAGTAIVAVLFSVAIFLKRTVRK